MQNDTGMLSPKYGLPLHLAQSLRGGGGSGAASAVVNAPEGLAARALQQAEQHGSAVEGQTWSGGEASSS